MKEFNTMLNVGNAKYVVNFHDGIKKHKDGSKFFDIRTFRALPGYKEFTKSLLRAGYIYIGK